MNKEDMEKTLQVFELKNLPHVSLLLLDAYQGNQHYTADDPFFSGFHTPLSFLTYPIHNW